MAKKNNLLELISPSVLHSLAGSQAFQLGQTYFEDGAVHKLSITEDAVRASVEGTVTYRVVLRAEDDELSSSCSCPRAGDGYFCKHCVAVGLACLASTGELSGKTEKSRDPWETIQSYLQGRDSSMLIALLLDAARRDERLYRSLLQKAERGAQGADLAAILRKSIDAATHTNGFVAWHEVGEWLSALDDVVDSLAELLQPATSSLLVELLEYAVERVEHMLEEVDDSGGGMGEIVMRIGELHLAACRMAGPDPVQLAGRLFKLEMTLPFGICDFDPGTYADVLGTQGLDRYRELALAKWNTVEPRHAEVADRDDRFAITRIMERLAEASGDIAQLVEIKSRNLSSAYHYLSIAELWCEAGQLEQAMEWAERGAAAFPDRTDVRLRDFLIKMYLHFGRGDDALQLAWAKFEERPVLENYKKLATVAAQVGQWDAQRKRALGVVDAAIAAPATGYRTWGRQSTVPDYTLRVAVALWEQDVDAAWQYANLGGCDRYLLIALAGALESTRLDHAIALYRRVIPVLLEQTNNAAYEEAIGLVQKMAAALNAHQRGQELGAYLGDLRTEFKRKRNFIRLLDQFACD